VGVALPLQLRRSYDAVAPMVPHGHHAGERHAICARIFIDDLQAAHRASVNQTSRTGNAFLARLAGTDCDFSPGGGHRGVTIPIFRAGGWVGGTDWYRLGPNPRVGGWYRLVRFGTQ
jgi:hypothetical protein